MVREDCCGHSLVEDIKGHLTEIEIKPMEMVTGPLLWSTRHRDLIMCQQIWSTLDIVDVMSVFIDTDGTVVVAALFGNILFP